MRLTIRDLLWLTLLAAVLVAWGGGSGEAGGADRDRLANEAKVLVAYPVDDLIIPLRRTAAP